VLTTFTAIAIGIVMAMAARILAGRLAGLSMTAVCGATIAYLLPPAFSFRVSEPRDVAALAIYGAIGLVLAGPGPARKKAQTATSRAISPRQHREVPARLLSDVMELARRDPEVRHVSVYEGHTPEEYRIFVAAYRVWPDSEAVVVGKSHEYCEPVAFPDWPEGARASAFDNTAGRVYQISWKLQD
jgi:hypothetical protein